MTKCGGCIHVPSGNVLDVRSERALNRLCQSRSFLLENLQGPLLLGRCDDYQQLVCISAKEVISEIPGPWARISAASRRLMNLESGPSKS